MSACYDEYTDVCGSTQLRNGGMGNFVLTIRRPPRSTRFPYSTLCRAQGRIGRGETVEGEKAIGQNARGEKVWGRKGTVGEWVRGDRTSTRLNSRNRRMSKVDVGMRKESEKVQSANGSGEIGRAHVRTPVTVESRMPSSA